ncbi:uncharacterized protein LOC143631566 [Bidens hawaiensis]|uniref:uncharacterized protein LOC143631566 n=1 Tax=Bidens hawaiensis TaxID=980011 RepID=UPI00404948B4
MGTPIFQKQEMVRSHWMYNIGHFHPNYLSGVQSFLKIAENDRVTKDDDDDDENSVGVDDEISDCDDDNENFNGDENNDISDGEDDHLNENNDNLKDMLDDLENNIGDNDQEKLQQIFVDSEKPVYTGCENFSKHGAMLKLFNLKAHYKWSDTSFTSLLDFLHALLPKDNELPISLYQAKKLICPMGLKVKRIHACLNDCMLFRNEFEKSHKCVTCGASRYKCKNETGEYDDDLMKNRAPAKLLWYFPVIPRLKRLFANANESKLLRWHAEERKDDGKLRHVADSPQWRNINYKFPDFGGEIRNIRFGLSSDGINPFGTISSRHSTWPVLMCVYNLPQWLCMKRKYIMMSLLIQGPKQPGNDIDVYLSPLIDDMKTLWNTGVNVYDAYKKENFMLRAMIFCTTSDFQHMAICHDIMTHMIPIAIRGLLPENIRHTITKLCLFFNKIHTKVIDLEELDEWQKEIIITLCELEMYFPPSFFDMMVHLISQIVQEIKDCGPVFLRYMYPFERYMDILKGYVRNRYRPDASIVEGYTSEEVTEFCTGYLDGVKSIGVPKSRHSGRLAGVGVTSGMRIIYPTHANLQLAHFVVLQHMTCMTPYIDEHMEELRSTYLHKTDLEYKKKHNEEFSQWIKNNVEEKYGETDFNKVVEKLGQGPDFLVKSYQGYDINGYTYYTKNKDDKSATQNCGVTLIASTTELF